MTKVKICGISDSRAFDAAVEAGADWVGFVFFPPSPRYVTPQLAASLSRRISGGPARVGLFVEPGIDDLRRALGEIPLDAFQIYAHAGTIAELAALTHVPIWRAVGVGTPADLPSQPGSEQRLVIEAKPPDSANRPGGNASAFDWSITRDWRAPRPWILAGGLTPENVASAIAATGAEAVDVSSGVEASKGRKDPAKIRAFIQQARQMSVSQPAAG